MVYGALRLSPSLEVGVASAQANGSAAGSAELFFNSVGLVVAPNEKPRIYRTSLRYLLPFLLNDGESQVSTENLSKIRLLLVQQPCLKLHTSTGDQIEQHWFPIHHRGHAGDVPGVSVIHRNGQQQKYHGLGNECLVGVAENVDRNIGRARA